MWIWSRVRQEFIYFYSMKPWAGVIEHPSGRIDCK